MELKPTEPHGYEFVIGPFDYHIRQEGRVWVLEQFKLDVKDADDAHVRTTEVESLRDGVQFALEES